MLLNHTKHNHKLDQAHQSKNHFKKQQLENKREPIESMDKKIELTDNKITCQVDKTEVLNGKY